jgi:rubrerythrin
MTAIEIARSMETDAIKFYTEAADKTRYPAGKKMFETIIKDEKRHLAIINRIIEGLEVTFDNISPVQNVKTVFETMKDQMMEKVEATDDELEAFKIAMEMEKKGKEYYEEMLKEAKTDKEKVFLQRLIKEEEQHYSIFENTYNFLSDTGNWFMWDEHSIVEG